MHATKLREVALEALRSDEPRVIRRSLTALAFVGTTADVQVIERFKTHSDSGVSKDAGTCLYQIKKGARLSETRSIRRWREKPAPVPGVQRHRAGSGSKAPVHHRRS